MKYPCNVIRDLLPLYVDEVCSAESRKMIEEHFKECSECKACMKAMSDGSPNEEPPIPIDPVNESRKASSLRKMKRKIRKRQILTAVVTVLMIICAGFAVIGGLKRVSRIVEYDEYNDNLSVSMVDGSLVGRLCGSSYTSLSIRNISADAGGRSSNYIFYRVSDTLWDDISTGQNMMTEYVICPAEKGADRVDRVYYYTGDLSGLEDMNEAELQTVIQNSVLLWEKTT